MSTPGVSGKWNAMARTLTEAHRLVTVGRSPSQTLRNGRVHEKMTPPGEVPRAIAWIRTVAP